MSGHSDVFLPKMYREKLTVLTQPFSTHQYLTDVGQLLACLFCGVKQLRTGKYVCKRQRSALVDTG